MSKPWTLGGKKVSTWWRGPASIIIIIININITITIISTIIIIIYKIY